MIPLRIRLFWTFAVAACPALALRAGAQSSVASESCDGRIVTAININAGRPPFAGSARRWQTVARAFGLHHATTRTDVVRSYLLFREGDVCSDLRIAESARILRGLPFLANATSRVRADSAGGVVVEIETTDEVPVLVAGSLRRSVPSALSVGSDNIGGFGLRVVGGGERGDVYRSAGRVETMKYALFDQPMTARFQAERAQLGGHVEFEVARPFLSDVERGAWQATFRQGTDFPIILRPVGDDETVEVHEQRWAVSGVVRSSVGSTVAIWGPVALGTSLTPVQRSIVLSDSGAITSSDTALLRRFSAFHAVRLGALLGVRRVRFVARSGLDALFAPQDVMTGWQVGGLAAPGATSGGGRELLLAHSIVFGAATTRAVLIGDAEAEASRDFSSGTWQSAIGNAHIAAYLAAGSRVHLNVQDNFSSLSEARLPTQLSLGDPIGGPRGYLGSNMAGGRRNLTRAELRLADPGLIRRTDVGIAFFADAATMWAGDVPYGVTASRQSVGVSLLAAYPTGSKRLYRLDFAIPIQRDGSRRLEIRFTNSNPTDAMTTEPSDVSQARLVPITSSLFAWPGR